MITIIIAINFEVISRDIERRKLVSRRQPIIHRAVGAINCRVITKNVLRVSEVNEGGPEELVSIIRIAYTELLRLRRSLSCTRISSQRGGETTIDAAPRRAAVHVRREALCTCM